MAHAPIRTARRAIRGMSLIEIMVGMVIGLIGMLVIFQSFQAFEGQKRTTTAGNDAQESGLMALTAVERDARMAGFGLFYANVPACSSPVMRVWPTRTAELPAPSATTTEEWLLPAFLQNDVAGAGTADAITLSYSTSAFAATPAQLQVDFTGTVARVVVDNSARNTAYATNQFILLGSPYSNPVRPCVRLQITGTTFDPTNPQFVGLDVSTASAANPGTGSLASFIGTAFNNSRDTPSVVVNMGALVRNRYFIANNRLMVRDLTNPASTNVELAEGIVNMQAQYGLSATATNQQVSAWCNAVAAAAAPCNVNLAAPAAADVGRIKAVRVAVVARAQLQERNALPAENTTCRQPDGAVNTNGPCTWIQRANTVGQQAPTWNLSGANWQNFRYRVYETIIPMRNVMWQSF